MEHVLMEVKGSDHFPFFSWVMAVGSSRSSSRVYPQDPMGQTYPPFSTFPGSDFPGGFWPPKPPKPKAFRNAFVGCRSGEEGRPLRDNEGTLRILDPPMEGFEPV